LQKSEEFLRSSCVNYYNYLRMLARLRAFNWNCSNIWRVFSFFDAAECATDTAHFSLQCVRLLTAAFLARERFLI
jgi:hypothetical protein